MCTVTVLPRSSPRGRSGQDEAILRVVCNRDERRARAVAVPPAVHMIGERRVTMPIDPDGGGTWVAANDRGLVFVLLNANRERARVASGGRQADRPSRGRIIPAIAASRSVPEALECALSLNLQRFNPFRLMLIDREVLIDCWLEASRLHHRRSVLRGPLMRTSSSLGDALVQSPRRALFRRLFDTVSSSWAAQDAFHDHQWPGREAVSVRMERADARTVSRTVVEVSDTLIRVGYQAIGGDAAPRLSIPVTRPPRSSVRRS